jgi:hypothetical protein
MVLRTPRPPGPSSYAISVASFKIFEQIDADTLSTTVFSYPHPNFIITRSSLMRMIQQCDDTSNLYTVVLPASSSPTFSSATASSFPKPKERSCSTPSPPPIPSRLSFVIKRIFPIASLSQRLHSNLSDALSTSLSLAFADFSSASALSIPGSMNALSVDISSISLELHACKELLASTRILCAARAKSVATLHARLAPPARPARMDALTEDMDFHASLNAMLVTFYYEHYDKDDITVCREELPSASVSRMFIFV